MSLYRELKRRNVFRVGAAYLVGAWLLIQVAETLFPLFGYDQTPARIVVTLLAIGFIPALVFAWAFEITPEGLKRSHEVDHAESITPETGKKLDRLIMVVLALALGYFAYDKFVLEPRREAIQQQQKVVEIEQARQEARSRALVESYGDKSIAVLPFTNMSDDAANEYFSDGISEELLNLLAKIPDLRVISRSSAFSYKDKDLRLSQIAEELNVAHILEGSVRKAGDRVRITAQLIEARSDTHLWSETYDRSLDDIFAIQDEIGAAIVDQLKVRLLGSAPKSEQADPQAYSLLLQSRHVSRSGSADSHHQSFELLEKAIEIDPNYAALWDAVGTDYINFGLKGLMPPNEAYALAEEALEKALAIDPEYASAHAGLAGVAMFSDHDMAAAAQHFEHALALEPTNLAILTNAAILTYHLGRFEQAIAMGEYVTARDPVNPAGHGNLGNAYLAAGRCDEAIDSYSTALRWSPDYIGAHYAIGAALLCEGDPESALEEVRQEPFEVFRLLGLVAAQHALGQDTESDETLDQLIGKYEREWAYNIAYVLAFRGEVEKAFGWLDKAVEYGDPGLAEILTQPWFASLYDDPRWLPFLREIGQAPEQLAQIEFKVSLPDN